MNDNLVYCENCDDWVEPDDGVCPNCDTTIIKKKENPISVDEDVESEDLEWY